MGSAIQPVLSPPHCPLTKSALPEIAGEVIMADGVQSLAEVQLDSIPCSSLIYPGS